MKLSAPTSDGCVCGALCKALWPLQFAKPASTPLDLGAAEKGTRQQGAVGIRACRASSFRHPCGQPYASDMDFNHLKEPVRTKDFRVFPLVKRPKAMGCRAKIDENGEFQEEQS